VDYEVLERYDFPVLRRDDDRGMLLRELLRLELVGLGLDLDQVPDRLPVLLELVLVQGQRPEPPEVRQGGVPLLKDDRVEPVLQCGEDDFLPVFAAGLE